MKSKYKAVELIETFDKFAMKGFRSYLAAFSTPYVINAFENLNRKRIWKELDKVKVAKILNISRKSADDCMSRLFSVACRFIAASSIEKHDRDYFHDRILMAYCSENGLNSFVNEIHNSAMVRSGINQHLSALDHYELYRLKRMFMIHQTINEGRGRRFDEAALAGHLDASYAIERSRLFCEEISRSTHVWLSEIEESMLSKTVMFLSEFKHLLLVDLYLSIAEYLAEPGKMKESDFESMVVKFSKLGLENVPKDDSFTISRYLVNFCTLKINGGHNRYKQLLVDFAETIQEKGLVLENGRMNGALFKVIVSTALSLKRHAFAENFFHKYGRYLPDESGMGIRGILLSQIHFIKGEYSKSRESLLSIDVHSLDVFHNCSYRLMLTKVSVHLFMGGTANIEECYRHIRNLKLYVRRQKVLNASDRERMANFIALLTEFLAGSLHGIDMTSKVQQCELVAERSWLCSIAKRRAGS